MPSPARDVRQRALGRLVRPLPCDEVPTAPDSSVQTHVWVLRAGGGREGEVGEVGERAWWWEEARREWLSRVNKARV